MRASAGEFGLILKPLNLVVLKKNKIKKPVTESLRRAAYRSHPLLGVRSGVSVLLERVADLAAKCVNS